MSEKFICQYCGMELPSADAFHDLQSCAEYLKSQIDKLTAENAALREQLRWIPVSERLPECEKYVLAHYTEGDYGVAWRNELDDGNWCAYPDNPTHWIPIPPVNDNRQIPSIIPNEGAE